MSSPQPAVAVTREGSIVVLTLDNPPVNALGSTLRTALHEALREALQDGTVRGIVIACAGKTFVAGADLSEFGTPRQTQFPILPDLCRSIETAPVPVCAAIHGNALGGGLELALACHYRVVESAAKLGLPEVLHGLIPGAGGTVRLPRLVGPEKALGMIASGAPIGAQDALAAGLADAVAQGDVAGAAIRFLREKIEAGATTTPVIARDDKLNAIRADPARFEALATATAARARGLAAPLACIEAVRNAIDLPAETALKLEREIFLARVASSESKALRHLFFAEREAAKVPDIGKEVKPRPVERIGVIGAGTMGGGIAMAFANAGFPVTLLEMSEAALQRGFGLIEKNYAASVSRGSLSESARAERMARLGGATDYAALAGCDLIIEAVFEDMAVKKEVFGRIEAVAKPGAILATNTSYLDVDEIARATGRPADVVGLHFFSPANVMKLLEIVRGAGTAPDVVVTALSLARRIGKVPVVVGVCHGFVGNRIYSAYRREAEYIMEDGASPYEIDAALVAFGMPMGVFAVSDLSGLDISYATRRSMDATRDPDERYVRVADRLVEAGRLGRKSGAGYYSYAGGKPEPDPVTLRIVAEERAARGITPRPFSQEEIQQRLLAVMTQEGEKILRERIAQRASDIDLVMINGYGFPRSKGGPMWLSRQAAGDG